MKLFSFFSILFIAIGCKSTPSNIVKTDKGTVEGFKKGDIDIFKGIPFAAPPVGDLRWKAPKEHEPWDGVLQTTAFSASPIQSEPKPFRMWSEEFISPPEPLSEDCLYLNIWSKQSKEKKPVFVWIYGGGFNSGSAACAIYDGEEYAKQDVVFVSINYRVNMFGYLAHPELSSENDEGISGNYGLLDQIQALKWVQKNIAAFGGDPNNVTVAGQSAGSMSVHALVASSLAKGLFNKAIGQSGGFLGGNRATSLKEAELKGKALFDKLEGKSMQELRKVPAKELFEMVNNVGYTSYAPVKDGVVLAEDLEGTYKSGRFNEVPFLGGWVSNDGRLFSTPEISPEDYKKEITEEYGEKADDYLDLFPGNNSDELQASISKKNMLSFAGLPMHLLAKYNSKPVYVYEISHIPVKKPDFPDYGAFHTSDVPLTLHNLHTWDRDWRETDRKAETLISSYWINFIKTGNPNSEGLPEWKAYDQRGVQVLNENASFKENLYQAELEILSK